jgi:hypothetical protein
METKISPEKFESEVHSIIKDRGIKINKSIVPETWRPRDIVIQVKERISKKEEETNFWFR